MKKVAIDISMYSTFHLSEEAILFMLNAKSKLVKLSSPEEYFINNPDDCFNVLKQSKNPDDKLFANCTAVGDKVAYITSYVLHKDKTRTNPILINAIEKLGKEASFIGKYFKSNIKVVAIPDDVKFYIDRPETGPETIHEKHRIWR